MYRSNSSHTQHSLWDKIQALQVPCNAIGLIGTPAIFVDYMNRIFKPFLDQFVVIFIDDILIYSKTEKEHEEHLRIMLQILKDMQLYVKLEKCELWLREVKFLGYMISQEGVIVEPSKVEAVMSWEKLRIVTKMKSFQDWRDTIANS